MQLQQIAERCQQGDHEAFALLYTATREQLRSVCLRYVHDETVADDLLHDAFLLIINKMGELKDTARVGAWLTSVTRNVALLYLRQQKQRQEVSLSSCTSGMLQPPTENNRAETTLAMQEIMAAVDALPDGYRRVFRLSVIEGLSHQEIASLLRIEPHSSSSQLFHAKDLLRHWLRPLLLLLLAVVLPFGLWWKFHGSLETGKMLTPPLTPPLEMHEMATQEPASTLEGREMAAQEVRGNEYAGAATPCSPLGSAACCRGDARRGGDIGEVCNLPLDDEQETNDMAETEIQTPPPAPPFLRPFGSKRQSRAEGQGMEAPDISFNQEITDKPDHSWTVEMAYSAIGDNGGTMQLPFADADTNPVVCDSFATHHFPLTVSLSVERRIGQHWQVGTGLSYSRMKSDFSIGNSYISQRQHQTVQYLGLPFSASYHWQLAKRLQLYAKASVTLHLPLRSTRNSYYLMPDGHKEEYTTERLHPGLQMSAGMGVGLQYQLAPHVSLFAEPSVQHFFYSGNSVSTWNTEHPFAPSVPFGLKIDF
jgi:RNA polymerase sigma-70 factor (ECF subfamily)